jgi:general secretion pathway protein M
MIGWRDSRPLRLAAFVAGNLALCVVIAVCAVMPTRAFFAEREDRIAEQRALLSRLTSIAAQESNVQSIARQAGAQAQRGEFLTGPNEGVVNADLQTRLKGMAEAAGAKLRSVQSLPAKTSEQIHYSGSRIEIYGPVQSIHRALYAIEGAKPYLFVTGASIKPAAQTGRSGVVEEPVIQAQLDIFGAVQIEAREP